MHVDVYAQSLQDRTMDLYVLDLLHFILGMYHMCPYNTALKFDVGGVSLILERAY